MRVHAHRMRDALRPIAALFLASAALGQSVVRLQGAHGRQIDTWLVGDSAWIVDFSPDDRRALAFAAYDALVPGDANGVGDAVWYDLWTGSYEIAVTPPGGAAPDGDTGPLSLSPGGGFMVIGSNATNLVPQDSNGLSDVFVVELATGSIRLASLGLSGAQPNDGCDSTATVSANGRWGAFSSWATNLGGISGTTPGSCVYVRDLVSNATEVASPGLGGSEPDGWCWGAQISADGRFVAFLSSASNLILGDTNARDDLFLRDRASGTLQRLSLGAGNVEADDRTTYFDMSPDARWFAFVSEATNLLPGASTTPGQVYLLDRASGALSVASVSPTGQIGDSGSMSPRVSDDGRYVAFFSFATNLDPLGGYDAYRFDTASGICVPVSRSSGGAVGSPPPGNPGWSDLTALSSSGRLVAFWSSYAGLVAGDTNQHSDAFVWDAQSSCGPIESYCTPKRDSLGCVPAITSGGEPYVSGPSDAFFVSASALRPNQNGALLWSIAPAAVPFAGGTRCVAAPSVRTQVQAALGSPLAGSSPCGGSYSFFFSRAYMASHGIGPGTTLYAQFWSRDPGFSQPDNLGLSDALRFTTSP